MTTVQRIGLALTAVLLLGVGVYLVQSDDSEDVARVAPEPASAAVPSIPTTPVGAVSPGAPPPAPSAVTGTLPADAPVAKTSADVAIEPSPFESGDSRELQYAVQLVNGPDTGPAQWNKAAEVFRRCFDENKFNFLCQRGLAAAYERIDTDGGVTHLLDPVVRTPTVLVPIDRPRSARDLANQP